MPSRHSKNNTALGHFTRGEREKLDWGSRKVRLTKDSVKKFDACNLCLKSCPRGLVCSKGGCVFHTECILEFLVFEKRKAKEQTALEQSETIELAAAKAALELERKLTDFADSSRLATDSSMRTESSAMHSAIGTRSSQPLAAAGSDRGQLRCFWMPALRSRHMPAETTSAKVLATDSVTVGQSADGSIISTKHNVAKKKKKKKSSSVRCPACECALRRKMLVPFEFTCELPPDAFDSLDSPKKQKALEESLASKLSSASDLSSISGRKKAQRRAAFICASCRSTLNNATRMGCLSRCGHIMCLNCIDKFVLPSKVCTVCEKMCTKKKVIMLTSGGTGFAKHDKLDAIYRKVAFQ